jgi:uncharacterized protein YjiS (DUF1127 family)
MSIAHFTNNSRHSASTVDGFVNIARHVLGATDLALTQIVNGAATWYQRASDRRALRALDDHLLSDIGLSRADVEFEASKRIWQA